jgi:hypothetical protein
LIKQFPDFVVEDNSHVKGGTMSATAMLLTKEESNEEKKEKQ